MGNFKFYSWMNSSFDLSFVFFLLLSSILLLLLNLLHLQLLPGLPQLLGVLPGEAAPHHLLNIVSSCLSPLHPHLAREVLLGLEDLILPLVDPVVDFLHLGAKLLLGIRRLSAVFIGLGLRVLLDWMWGSLRLCGI